MIATTIDLSKIAAKEYPRKTIALNFGDAEKEYFIHPLNEADMMCLRMMYQGDADRVGGAEVMLPKKLYVLLLTAGLEAVNGNQDVAQYLLDHATSEAIKAGDAIFAYTNEFFEAKNKETEVAEKNSGQPVKSGENA